MTKHRREAWRLEVDPSITPAAAGRLVAGAREGAWAQAARSEPMGSETRRARAHANIEWDGRSSAASRADAIAEPYGHSRRSETAVRFTGELSTDVSD